MLIMPFRLIFISLSDNDDATDQVYNIALNDKTSLNTLYKMIEENFQEEFKS